MITAAMQLLMQHLLFVRSAETCSRIGEVVTPGVYFYLFTALHAMQTRSSDENSVRLSVGLSVRHTRVL